MTNKAELQRPLLIRACFGEKTERAPAWIMRQAGRYLPEYRAIRSKTTFLGLCKTPELAAEVTLQPVDVLGVDAAIIFSDILIVPEAMGQELSVEENQGPKLYPVIQDSSDLKKLKKPKPEKAYSFLGKALALVRKNLSPDIPLIGFAGSPFTLMAYMVEGQGSKDFGKVKNLLKENPKLAHRLLEKLSESVADLLNYQIESGAQVVQIFDSWGGILTQKEFSEFSLTYVRKVISNLNLSASGWREAGGPPQYRRSARGGSRNSGGCHSDRTRSKANSRYPLNKSLNKSVLVPVIFFARGTGQYLEKIKRCGADVISLDWTVDLKWARKILGKKISIQGNMDPLTLFSSPLMIRDSVEKIFTQINPRQGYIFNLGHGILPNTSPDHAKYLLKCVKELSRA